MQTGMFPNPMQRFQALQLLPSGKLQTNWSCLLHACSFYISQIMRWA